VWRSGGSQTELPAQCNGALRDPANRRLSGSEVLERVAPWLRVGSSESDRFHRALADYRQVVDQCQLQAPEQSGAGQRCMVANTMTFDR
jgi:hypothetical protein